VDPAAREGANGGGRDPPHLVLYPSAKRFGHTYSPLI
jgi:hypothetical protein